MKRATSYLVIMALWGGAAVLPAYSAASANPQDVPQQQPPGTNNPDISKQRRPAPAPPKKNPDQSSADVPQQEPGTNNPDVGSQRHGDKSQPDVKTKTSPEKKDTSKKKSARKKTDTNKT